MKNFRMFGVICSTAAMLYALDQLSKKVEESSEEVQITKSACNSSAPLPTGYTPLPKEHGQLLDDVAKEEEDYRKYTSGYG